MPALLHPPQRRWIGAVQHVQPGELVEPQRQVETPMPRRAEIIGEAPLLAVVGAQAVGQQLDVQTLRKIAVIKARRKDRHLMPGAPEMTRDLDAVPLQSASWEEFDDSKCKAHGVSCRPL